MGFRYRSRCSCICRCVWLPRGDVREPHARWVGTVPESCAGTKVPSAGAEMPTDMCTATNALPNITCNGHSGIPNGFCRQPTASAGKNSIVCRIDWESHYGHYKLWRGTDKCQWQMIIAKRSRRQCNDKNRYFSSSYSKGREGATLIRTDTSQDHSLKTRDHKR